MVKPLACGMALTLFLQLKQSKIDLLIILDWLRLSVLTFCIVSAIKISVKRHISTSLIDIKHALRLLPVHPTDRHLLAMHWKNQILCLPFRLRSAPKLFNTLADFNFFMDLTNTGNHTCTTLPR